MDGVTADGLWIDLRDYMLNGVRKESLRQTSTDFGLPAPPDTWVDLRAFAVDGVRPVKRKKRIEAPPPPPSPPKAPPPTREPPPPEHYWTIFQALAEVYAALDPRGPVSQELERMLALARQKHREGVLPLSEIERFSRALEEIRTDYALGSEGVVDWYLENYFRLFHTEPHDSSFSG
ncbi:MAG: hypothetical protein HQL66_05190 [Magnetococcales bacterium]|nr:hypothetical protein [Magnetococcales bacterium]